MIRIFPIFVILLSLFAHTALSTVLGIDYGSDKVKIAAVQPGKAFEIVLDEASKRSHSNLVVFGEDYRQYGTSATSLVTRRPNRSFLFFTRLLGKPGNTSMIDELKKDYLFNSMTSDDKRGTLRFKSPYYNHNQASSSIDDLITAQSYTVEEITSMKLKHIKKIAEDATGGDVSDCVMTVPEFYSAKERQALKDAAQLAGLNVYGLINVNTAAAVQYGLKRDFSSNKTEYMLFYNMGATSTIVSIVKYWAYDVKDRGSKSRTVGCVDVMSQSWDETLGGNAFDRIISKILIKQAKELLRKQTDPEIEDSVIDNLENDGRFTARIRNAANKAKKILSANTETFVGIEGVYNDIDFKTTITRDEMYSESESLFVRAVIPLDEAIENVNGKIDKSDLDGIVIIGGSTRIPKIKDLLTEYLGKELRQDLNADESPALGAAFRAANLSSTFRVLGVNVEDITSFPVGVRLSNLAEKNNDKGDGGDTTTSEESFAKRGSLFSKNNNVYKRRAVTLKHNENLHVALYYEKYAKLPMDTSTDLGSFEITGVDKAVNKYQLPDYNITGTDEMPKVTLSFLLDADGLVDLVQATASFTEYITEERKIPKKTRKDKDDDNDDDITEKVETDTDDTTTNEENTEKTDENTDENTDDNAESSDNTDNSDATDTSGTDDDDNDNDDELETEMVSKKRTHKVDLNIRRIKPSDVKSYDVEDFEESFRMLMELDERDHRILATAAARNELESYIFESRSKLYEDKNVEKVSTESEREDLLSKLSEAEDWIWEVSAEDESEYIFQSKTNELRKIGDVIFNRGFELELRPKAIDAAGKAIGQLHEYVEVLKVNYTWVNINDTNKLYNMTRRVETWLNDKIELQSGLTLLEEPAFQSSDVQRRIVPILEYANKLLSKPKPYDYYKKDKKKKNKNGTKDGNDTEIDGNDTTSDEEDEFSVPIKIDVGGDDMDSKDEDTDTTDGDDERDDDDDEDDSDEKKKGEL